MRLTNTILFFATASLAACGSVTSTGDGDGDGDVDAGGCDGVVDCNGVCNGGAVEDCAGVCAGTAVVDGCGFCAEPDGACAPLLPDSETAVCNDGNGDVACPSDPAGQDGNLQINVPVYVVNAATVTDPTTGLEWERQPPFTDTDFAVATARCENLTLGGQNDWRLPTRFELATLIDGGRRVPPWPMAFGAIPQNSFLWTSTVNPASATQSYTIGCNFPTPQFDAHVGDASNVFEICVRGTELAPAELRDDDATVFDPRTNLIWQSSIAPAPLSWQDALAHCEDLVLDGRSDWRLPNLKELYSIVDDTRSNPAISDVFAERPATSFWSSTPTPQTVNAYPVNFNNGLSALNVGFATLNDVRCVHSP